MAITFFSPSNSSTSAAPGSRPGPAKADWRIFALAFGLVVLALILCYFAWSRTIIDLEVLEEFRPLSEVEAEAFIESIPDPTWYWYPSNLRQAHTNAEDLASLLVDPTYKTIKLTPLMKRRVQSRSGRLFLSHTLWITGVYQPESTSGGAELVLNWDLALYKKPGWGLHYRVSNYNPAKNYFYLQRLESWPDGQHFLHSQWVQIVGEHFELMDGNAPLEALGSFEVKSDVLRVGDPIDPRSSIEIPNAKSGTWTASMAVVDGLCSRLELQHQATGLPAPLQTPRLGLETAGWVETTSKQLGIFDGAKSYEGGTVAENHIWTGLIIDPDNLWYSLCSEATMNDLGGAVIPHGAVSRSGPGNGSYRVMELRDADGMVVLVTINFLFVVP